MAALPPPFAIEFFLEAGKSAPARGDDARRLKQIHPQWQRFFLHLFDTANSPISPASFILRGTLAARPAATAVAEGTLYRTTDAGYPLIFRSNGVAWQFFGAAEDSGGLSTLTLTGDITGRRLFSIIGDAQAGLAAILTSYSDTPAFGGLFLGRHARNTEAAPAALQSGDILGGVFVQGHDGTAFGPTNVGAIRFTAAENYAVGAKGTILELATTPIGSATRATRVIVSSAGLVAFGATLANTVPALKPSGAGLQVRLGDDSADANLQLAQATISSGVNPSGGGFQHKRVTTGSVGAGASALVTITWGTAFPDTNYTVSASVLDTTTSTAALSVVHVESISTTAITVRVVNNGASAITGTVHAIAIHD
jgi:hypothetical protein